VPQDQTSPCSGEALPRLKARSAIVAGVCEMSSGVADLPRAYAARGLHSKQGQVVEIRTFAARDQHPFDASTKSAEEESAMTGQDRVSRRAVAGAMAMLPSTATVAGAPAFAATGMEEDPEAMHEQDTRLLRDLAAREEIKALRARYGWHAARGDYERIVALFTPTGVFELQMDGKRRAFRGQDEIRTFLRGSMVPGMVFPMIHNEIVVVTGDEAVGSCAMQSISPIAGNPGFSGYYHDRAVKTDGRWLFSERRYFFYAPQFERSGLGLTGEPETGLAAIHDRKVGT
jgi:hypothetical protein